MADKTKRTSTTQTAFRLPDPLLARIDGYAANLKHRTRAQISKNEAARILLELALDIVDKVERAGLTPDVPVILDLFDKAVAEE